MIEKAQYTRNERTFGDTAVDGLLIGIAAGVGMMVYLELVTLLSGRGVMWVLTLFDPTQMDNALTGLLAHLAVSSIYGVIFALLVRGLAWLRPSWAKALWLSGALYGLLLFALAEGVTLRAVEAPLLQIWPLHFATAHVVYGLILGYWLGRK